MYTFAFHWFCFVYFEIIQKQKAKQYAENLSAKFKTQIKVLA